MPPETLENGFQRVQHINSYIYARISVLIY